MNAKKIVICFKSHEQLIIKIPNFNFKELSDIDLDDIFEIVTIEKFYLNDRANVFQPWYKIVYKFNMGNIKKFEIGLLSFISEKHKDVIESIEKVKKLDDAMEEKIKSIVTEYKGLFQA